VDQDSTAEAPQVSIPGLTFDQVRWLLNLIDIPKGGYEKLAGKPAWMIDSGASCHMTCDLEKIGNVQPIRPIPICLPNGTHTLAEKQGKITLGEKMCLNEVLYVPELNCNLLSVAKLCKDLNCAMTFFDESCVL